MNWDWHDGARCCHRCGQAIPSHSTQCSVPSELALFERVLARLKGDPAKRHLAERMHFFLAWFGHA